MASRPPRVAPTAPARPRVVLPGTIKGHPRRFRTAALLAGATVGAALLALWRRDIPYEILETRYGDPTSRFVLLPGGVRLHYRDAGPPDAPVLLLLHGFAASSADWAPWIERLGTDHRVIAVDLPGHGLTAAVPGHEATIPGLVALVAALAGTLRLAPFVLVGSSMGGHVAWRFALEHPDAVRGLVLVGSIGWTDTRSREGKPRPAAFKLLGSVLGRFALRHLDLTVLVRRSLRNTFGDRRLATPAAVRRTTDLSRAPGHRAILTTLDAGGGDRALLDRLATLRIPTLVMAGEADRLVPVTHARRFADAIPGAGLVTYPGVGHVPMVELPDRSADDLRSWLATAEPKRSPRT